MKVLSVSEVYFPSAFARSLYSTAMRERDMTKLLFASLSNMVMVVMAVVNVAIDSRSA